MVSFPEISPNIFSFSAFGYELTLRWYALAYIVGFIFALIIMKFFVRRYYLWPSQKAPMTLDQADSILTYLIIGVILGGRLGYVVFYNLGYYLEYPTEILQIWDGGMSFHGGFLGVIIAVWVYSLANKISLLTLSDLIAIATPPGLFLGRIANFINAELWGRPTDVAWGVIFPGEAAQNCPGFSPPCARHPSQLYEAGLEGFLLFCVMIIFVYAGAFRRPGRIAGIFFLGYGFARFFVEYYRVPDNQFISERNPLGYVLTFSETGITMGQLLCLPMMAVGILLIFLSFRKITSVLQK